MTPFVQACVLCGDHKRFMHDPHLIPCPTCRSPYCRRCYSSLPLVKVGLLRKERQCPRCAQESKAARALYRPAPPPAPTSPPPPAPVAPPQVKEIVKEVVRIPCSYCGTLVDQTATSCPACGASFRVR